MITALLFLLVFFYYSVHFCDCYKFQQFTSDNFTDSILNVYDSVLQDKNEIFIFTDGRKTTNRYVGPLAHNAKNPVTLFSMKEFISTLQKKYKNRRGNDCGVFIITECNNEYLQKFFEIISFNHLYLVLAFYKNATDKCLRGVFEKCRICGIFHTMAVVNNDNGINIIRSSQDMFPNCTRTSQLHSHAWNRADNDIGFAEKHYSNMLGCQVNISSIHIPPNVILRPNTDIKDRGYEYRLIHALSEDMNFTINIVENKHFLWGGIDDNGTATGMVGEVYNGISEIGFGVIWPSPARMKYLDISRSFAKDCLGWVVPTKAASRSTFNALTGYLTKGFKIIGWNCIFVTIIVFVIIYTVQNKMLTRQNGNDLLTTATIGFLITISMLVQKPVPVAYTAVPKLLSFNVLFTFWLIYSQIVSSIYSAFLSGLLVVPDEIPNLLTLEDILNSGLDLATNNDILSIIRGISDTDPVYKAILRKIQVKIPPEKYIKTIIEGAKMAYCRNYATLLYYSRKYVNDKLYVLDSCFVNYPIVLIFQRGSYFTNRANTIIDRLQESGIIELWKQESILSHIVTTASHTSFQPEKFDKVIYIFYFYALGMSLSILAFTCEILYRKYYKRKQNVIINRQQVTGFVL